MTRHSILSDVNSYKFWRTPKRQMQGAATQAMPQRIVEERQRSRCLVGVAPGRLRLAKTLTSLLARYIPQRVCASLAPRHRLCEPAAEFVTICVSEYSHQQ